MSYSRFAIYYVPPVGPLADAGAAWLGWDIIQGRRAVQPNVPGLHDITMTPQKYGLHGTLKPPFSLSEGTTQAGLEEAAAALAATLAPAKCDGLELVTLGGFLALTPQGDMAELRHVAEACVRGLDGFRAAPNAAELARRRKAGLSARQEALLMDWGYPYVMDEFRFHLTLSGRLSRTERADWFKTVQDHLPELPSPFVIDQIALCAEREDGRFELLHRYTLAG